ncbi:hypothetical protein A2154_05175 [Candidatus Gottesmanbacteria bacterium RBG_16_43_7]|uniref:Photosystem I assembly BtpA n=1 Tax=Candidatus Gottesmanbacteria bacterium RBG_16_43_7 TaxID=1798373 RepID=A0A1F5ZD11_9BACT|nr:MAG: hypothetical protein A2154_05175 [Candidatus Gottesmanbacteria bacterium RBG_16_43_7]
MTTNIIHTKKFLSLFKKLKPVIGMVHLPALRGEPGYVRDDYVIKTATFDIAALHASRVDGLLIENWHHDGTTPFVSEVTVKSMSRVLSALRHKIVIPWGINVLHNDYRAAFQLAIKHKASFVQLDVFTDQVESDFAFSPEAKKHPFTVKADADEIMQFRQSAGVAIPLIVFVQPKHYRMLEANVTIEQSVKRALAKGADGVIVTNRTGKAPDFNLIRSAKLAAQSGPVGVGSGVSVDNVCKILKQVDFVIVGTSIKYASDITNAVSIDRVRALMGKVKYLRKNAYRR